MVGLAFHTSLEGIMPGKGLKWLPCSGLSTAPAKGPGGAEKPFNSCQVGRDSAGRCLPSYLYLEKFLGLTLLLCVLRPWHLLG